MLDRRLGNKRKACRIADGFHRDIHVELRPIQMILRRTLNVQQLLDCCFLEPREIGERYRELLVPQEYPEAVFRYVGDLSRQSDDARHFQSPKCAPRPPPALAGPE